MAKKRIGRPPGSDGVVSRRQIVEIAVRLLAQNGYAATTVKQIAAEAGVTTGAVYHYFESKRQLVIDVYAEAQRELIREYEAAVSDDLSLAENVARILECVRAQSDSFVRNLSVVSSSLVLEATRHTELEPILVERNAFEELIRRVVLRGVARGETAPEVDAQAVIDLVMTLFQGLSARLASPITIQQHKRTLLAAELLLRGHLFVRGEAPPEREPTA